MRLNFGFYSIFLCRVISDQKNNLFVDIKNRSSPRVEIETSNTVKRKENIKNSIVDRHFLSFFSSGQLAMDVLHKQIKPFMLRRLKSDVLDDLPPKILQDYFCDLSSIQCLLYEDFANKAKEQFQCSDQETTNQNGNSATGHVFKALQYLRKLCNHPSLILTPEHPKWLQIQKELKESQTNLNDIRLSGKLLALKFVQRIKTNLYSFFCSLENC